MEARNAIEVISEPIELIEEATASELQRPRLIREKVHYSSPILDDKKKSVAEQKEKDRNLQIELIEKVGHLKIELSKQKEDYTLLNKQFEEIIKTLSSIDDEEIVVEIKKMLTEVLQSAATEILLFVKSRDDDRVVNNMELLKKKKFMKKGFVVDLSLAFSDSYSDPKLAAFLIQLATQMSYILHWTEKQTHQLNDEGPYWVVETRPLLDVFTESIDTYEKAPRLKRVNIVGCSSAYFGKEHKIVPQTAFLYYPATEKDLQTLKQEQGTTAYVLKMADNFHLKLYKLSPENALIELKLNSDIVLKKKPGNLGLFKVIPGKEKKIDLDEVQLQEIHKAIALDLDSLEVKINERQNMFLTALKLKAPKKYEMAMHLKGTPWENIYGHAELPSTHPFTIKPLAVIVGDKINKTRILDDKAVAVKGYTLPVTAIDEKDIQGVIVQSFVKYDAFSRRGKSITFQYSKKESSQHLIKEERVKSSKKKA